MDPARGAPESDTTAALTLPAEPTLGVAPTMPMGTTHRAGSSPTEAPPIDRGEPPLPSPRPERWIAGRYRLHELLGGGAHGEVWEAHDRLSREWVAVKLLRQSSGAAAARVRREVAALRLLRLPGIVRLIDEGVEDGRAFLVMERVEGAPFPGVPVPCSFAELAGPLAALLEALARMHAMGVVHRDLKPANVLVDPDGRVTVLDLGLSHFDAPVLDGLTEAGQVLGTPGYLAPEQIGGEAITARADVYAVGVMAYVSLTGRIPHDAPTVSALLLARLTQRPTPLRDLAPEVPGSVAALIDQLLARYPADRPRSALEVLARLRGQRAAGAFPALPRLGPGEPLRALGAAAAEGRSIDVVGQRGAGRSRLLDELEEALGAQGRRVLRTAPASAPFASLEPILGTLDEHAARSLAVVTAAVDAAVREALAGGAVLLVDDAERVDAASAASLERCRGDGTIIFARASAPAAGAVVLLAPLDEASLRALFVGPDRLFHLREDAARALGARTGGLPALVADEIGAWARAGLARWDGALLSCDRGAIERLEGAVAAPLLPALRGEPVAPLPPRLADLLGWIGLAGPCASVALLAPALREPPWRVEAEVADLVARGAARVLPDGSLEPCADARRDESWSVERTEAAHRALAAAQRPGAPGRLWHLLAGGAEAELAAAVAREASLIGEGLAREGHLGRAVVPIGEGLRALRRLSPAPVAELGSLLSLWVEIALQEGTPHALDRVLYELCRPGPSVPAAPQLEALVRAALAVGAWTPRAAQVAGAVPRFADARLELGRLQVRLLAARRCSLDQEEELVAEAARWVEASGHAPARAHLAWWQGRLSYCRGRFEEAAALHARAAAGEAWLTVTIAARLDAASALMEAFRLDEAAAWAAEALAMAARCRHALFEARAEWLVRALAYRTGRTDGAGAPDRELVEASALLGAPHLEGLLRLTEAAIAFRAGDLAAARELVTPAYRLWSEAGHPLGPLLSGALLVACGAPLPAPDVAALVARSLGCEVAGVGVQALALLAGGGVAPAADEEALRALAALVPERFWDRRMEVLSVDESLARLSASYRSS